MNEFKLVVAGGRDYVDAHRLESVLNSLADFEYADCDISLVSGMAAGADRLAYEFAKLHGIQCYTFPADWARHGKAAGFIRNRTMGDFADGLVAFWDGQSLGTKHMIEYMRKLGKPVNVIKY